MEEKNENFVDLLDNYLDEKEIELKKQYDYDEMAREEKKLAIARGILYDDAITIHSFLKNYLHTRTNGDMELTLTTLKYLGLTSGYVMGVHDNFAKNNPELVDQGFLLLVKDPNHNRGTYINPQYIDKLLNKDILDIKLKKFSNPQTINLEDLSDYYDEYQELLKEKENNEITYDVIKKTHKVKKFEKLKEVIEKSDKND